jgi:collagen triple helix repeat protein
MYSRLQKKFGTAGLVVAVVALVAALAGVAFAASGLNPKQKKEVEKIAKKVGKPGPAGPAGPQGPAGPKGDAGANGANGAAGAAGAPGVTGATGPTGQNGTNGAKGATGATGPTGVTGPEGVCSTSNCVLPTGTTETGAWSFGPVADSNGANPGAVNGNELRIPISFPIPLAAPIVGGSNIHLFEGTSIPEPECTGTVEAGKVVNLGAAPGQLCIYLRDSSHLENELEGNPATPVEHLLTTNAETAGFFQAGKKGAFLINAELEEGARASGTWAVTAP